MRRWLHSLVPLAATLAWAEVSAAQSAAEKELCSSQHAESQKLRRAGELIAAKKLLLACARESCPAVIRRECGDWAQEVEAVTPSLVIDAARADGSVASDFEIRIDGRDVASGRVGLPIAVDPGTHEVEVKLDGKSQKRRVLVTQGERERRVRFRIGAEVPPAPRSERRSGPPREPRNTAPQARGARGIPSASIVLGAVGVVALGSFGYFGYRAKTRADELDACSPRCDRGEADAMRQTALVADVSLGIGVVALGLATYFWAAQPHASESARSARRMPKPRLEPDLRF